MDCLPRLDSAKLYDMSHQHVNKLLCVTESFCLVVLVYIGQASEVVAKKKADAHGACSALDFMGRECPAIVLSE